MSRALNSAMLARGALELLWDSCYEAGDDYVGTAEDIEALVGWSGELGMLTRALVEAGAPEGQGFLEPVQGTVNGAAAYRVHDLWHHAPDYVAKRRKRELERQQKAAPGSDSQTAPNGGQRQPSPDWQNEVPPPPSPSPSPSHSPSHKNVSAEASSAPTTLAVLVFPVVGKGPDTWPLSEAQVAEWAVLYPGLDVLGEARKALAWTQANVHRRKTAGGMSAFLVNWFNRVVNRRGGGTAGDEPAFTPREIADATRVRSNWSGRCQHEPPCADGQACLGVIIREWRRERGEP